MTNAQMTEVKNAAYKAYVSVRDSTYDALITAGLTDYDAISIACKSADLAYDAVMSSKASD